MLTTIEWSVFIAISAFVFLIAMFVRKSSVAKQRFELPKDQLAWLPALEIGSHLNREGDLSDYDKLDVWLHRIISQSGLGLNLELFLLLNFMLAFLATGVTLEVQGEVFISIFAGAISFAFGFLAVYVAFSNRRKKFSQQFPVAVDLIACSVAAGQSFQEAIETAVDSIEEPASMEFLRCSRELNMGMSSSKCVQRLANRIPIFDVKIFAHTVSVHEEMGGQLGATLRRLAIVVRERSDDVQKVKAATSLGKFAAAMICSIGFIALLYMLVFEPDYIGKLMTSQIGQRMAVYAVISEIVGIACVLFVLQTEA